MASRELDGGSSIESPRGARYRVATLPSLPPQCRAHAASSSGRARRLRHRLSAAPLALLLASVAIGTACKPEEFPGGRDSLRHPTPVEGGSASEATDSVVADSAGAGAKSRSRHAERVGPAAAVARARGLWVLAEGSERVLDDPARVPAMIDRAKRLGITDLFVQVYRGGRAFYPADPLVERAPTVGRFDVDPLALVLRDAHAAGMRVHAWVNVLSLATRPDAKLIADLGRDAIHVDRRGRSLLDYPDFDLPQPDRQFYRLGTPGLFLDPAVPAVRERIVFTFRDLVTRYPALDGVHLDYIRHPDVLPFIPGSRFGVGLEFGYGAVSRARYRAETRRPDPIEGAEPGVVRDSESWDAWRRAQVTALVEEIGAAIRAARPGILLSAAVIPYVERCYLSLAQDWPQWLESGALDRAIPMVYTTDDRILRYQLEGYGGLSGSDRIWPGLGVWLFAAEPARALAQLERLRSVGFTGEVLFSDDAIAQAPALLEALAVSSPAAVP